MERKHNSENNYNILKLGIILLFLVVLISGISLGLNYYSNKRKVELNLNNYAQSTRGKIEEQKWVEYKDVDHGFAIKYPAELEKLELGSEGGYHNFYRFEEPEIHNSVKGFAIGIGKLPLNEETNRIKSEMEKDQIAELQVESDVKVFNLEAKSLYYKPKNESLGEERQILVFNNGNYSYSVSTVPYQMENLVRNFSFITATPTPTP